MWKTDRERRQLSSVIRRMAGASGSACPIVFVDGDQAPKLVGRSWHYTTPGGRPVYYPNAYRRAWGKPVYHRSTRRIEVGRDCRIVLEQL